MLRLVVVRIAQGSVAVLAATALAFFLVRLTGDPVSVLTGPTSTPEDIAALREHLGLNRPVVVQYFLFMDAAVRGDFGESIRFHQPALALVLDRVPASLALAAVSLVLTLLIAVPGGVYAAAAPGGVWDRVMGFVAAVGQATPAFWTGTILIALFGVRLGWLPTFGNGGVEHIILPAATLSLVGLASLSRLTRSSMIEVLQAEYIKFALTKGASRQSALWRHAFRNACLTVLTFSGLLFIQLISGAVIVETVFSWPGTGQLLVQSALTGDFPIVQVIVLLLVISYTVVNLGVDIAYGYLNPRVRLA